MDSNSKRQAILEIQLLYHSSYYTCSSFITVKLAKEESGKWGKTERMMTAYRLGVGEEEGKKNIGFA
ncbi:unnamed protein product [Enterobius vermicularis]|uniref:Uncharacterized protein n=1 Tax=Enterobius vermicularis TaxID=51028 RepID=A0A0N4VK28_ENTVE|nr:unnamed protein product [Enterobius vermicularis]